MHATISGVVFWTRATAEVTPGGSSTRAAPRKLYKGGRISGRPLGCRSSRSATPRSCSSHRRRSSSASRTGCTCRRTRTRSRTPAAPVPCSRSPAARPAPCMPPCIIPAPSRRRPGRASPASTRCNQHSTPYHRRVRRGCCLIVNNTSDTCHTRASQVQWRLRLGSEVTSQPRTDAAS